MTKDVKIMPLGPVMIDVDGVEMTEVERQRLLHPHVGGVILFARNYQNKEKLVALIKSIKALRSPALLVAVDQEGGRVQRFVDEFTRLPAAQTFGELWEEDKQSAPMRTFDSAYTMASELIEVGVDFSFAPIFDVASVSSDVIGNRCFHPDPNVATELLGAYIDGMHAAGMVSIAKHFPGHGGVSGDSHHCLPTDGRSFEQISEHDLIPYRELVDEIQGVMTSHILFSACDSEISTYSTYWLKSILREQMKFNGVVFSDDLTMQGAIDAKTSSIESSSAIVRSAQQAFYAGCDMVLVCNKPDVADELLNGLEFTPNEVLSGKLASLSSKKSLV